MKENIVLVKSIEFAVDIIAYSEHLEKMKKYVISRQLLKSGTSIGANMHEAQNAESKADFIHKVKIAAKEVEETKYWLLLCKKADSYPSAPNLEEKLEHLAKIIYKILSSSKRK